MFKNIMFKNKMFKKYELTFTIISPFMTGSNAAASFGLDDNMPVNHEKHPLIPGTLIKGVLHDVLKSVGYANIKKVFGEESAKGTISPQNGSLIFTDFLGKDPITKTNTLTRIAINETTGSVEKGALQVIELPFAVGQEVEFEGVFYIEESLKDETKIFEKALALVPSIGAFKSAGFGQVKNFKITQETENEPEIKSIGKEQIHKFSLTFSHPFLVNATRLDDNIFEGSVFISGGAIKGAIARVLGTSAVNECTIKQAYPVIKEFEQRTLPFSRVLEGDLFHDEIAAPIFQIDWKEKDRNAIYKCENIYFPQFESRTRTAINGETSAAENEKVFVYNMVLPLDEKGGNIVWFFEIIASSELLEQIQNLTIFVGKMDSPAKIAYVCGHDLEEQTKTDCTIKLETDCIMFDENCDTQDLKATYQSFFKAQLGKDVVVEEFYAQQKMVGGWQTLNAKRYSNQDYFPFIATKAGSVFKLKAIEPSKLKEVLTFGFKPYGEFKEWQEMPLSNKNGFGEISILGGKNVA